MTARVAMVTYSTRPRGGVVHALELTEALAARGRGVHLFALGDPATGFGRAVRTPVTIVPAPPRADTLTQRVFDSATALEEGLAGRLDAFDLVHVQDCVAARAALALRGRGGAPPVVRTVHHVDDFATPALVECQRRSIVEPDHVLVVSTHWRNVLRRDFGVEAEVVTNGVDAARFAQPDGVDPGALRRARGLGDRFLFLTVGGIEPRKGTMELVEAFADLAAELPRPPALAVVGGHSFQDHTPYRERTLRRVRELGLGEDELLLLGTVTPGELVAWYHAADAFVFPSVNEGWGLAVLEALSAGLPVVATSIPVFREYLTDGTDAVLVSPHAPAALADAMHDLVHDADLRARLGRAGPATAARFTWAEAARRHVEIYDRIAPG